MNNIRLCLDCKHHTKAGPFGWADCKLGYFWKASHCPHYKRKWWKFWV